MSIIADIHLGIAMSTITIAFVIVRAIPIAVGVTIAGIILMIMVVRTRASVGEQLG